MQRLMPYSSAEQSGLYGWAGLTPQPENVPATLRSVPHWVLWKAIHTIKNGTEAVSKIPYRAGFQTGKASSTDSSTWTDFDTAVLSYEEEADQYSGIGFVLSDGLGIVGLDFDHCVDMTTGEINPAIEAVLMALETYAELSPSGTGIRAIMRTDMPITRNKVTAAENGICDAEAYKSGRYLTITGHCLFNFSEVRSINAADVREILANLFPDRTMGTHGDSGDSNGSRFDITEAFRKVLTAESLHDQLTPMAASLAAQGMPERAATGLLEALLDQAAQHDGARAERVRGPELWRIVKSAYAKYQRPEPEDDEPSELDQLMIWDAPVAMAGRLAEKPAPIEWVVDGRIQAGRGILITGIGGSSKTRFLCQLGVGSAIGQLSWNWTVKRTGKAVLILTEDTAEDAHRTLWAIGNGLRLTDAQQRTVEQNVIVYALAGNDMKLLAHNEQGELTKTQHFHNLEEKIKEWGDVVFIGIDPALSVTEGDEMSQADQRTLGKMIDDLAVRTGAAAALVSHAAKGSQQTEEITSHSSRGAGAITDAVRGEFGLRTMTAGEATKFGILDIEERKRHVQLVATKGNHLTPEAFAPIWLQRGEYGVLSEVQLTEAEPKAAEVSADAAHDAFMVLVEMARHETVTRIMWQREMENRGLLRGSNDGNRRKMSRIVDSLSSRGWIVRGVGKGVWTPSPDRI